MKKLLIICLIMAASLYSYAGEKWIYFIDAARSYYPKLENAPSWQKLDCTFFWNGDGTCDLYTPESTINLEVIGNCGGTRNLKYETVELLVVDRSREVVKLTIYYYNNGECYITFLRGSGQKFSFRVTALI